MFQLLLSFLECIIGLMKPLPPTPYVRQLRCLAIFFLVMSPVALAGCIILAKYSFFPALGSFLLSIVSMGCAGWIGGKLIKLEVPEDKQETK